MTPEPYFFSSRLAELHSKAVSPNGMFGHPVPTACRKMTRTVTWETNWAKCFTNLLNDVINYDIETNGKWEHLENACQQVIHAVIPRLLGALQSNGRSIKPTLIHGDLWERNIGIDKVTGKLVVFDPGCIYAHNEMEFGMWRCSWRTYFRSPAYLQTYQAQIPPSEPVDEWDDRNRLYSVYVYLVESAGHPGSESRRM